MSHNSLMPCTQCFKSADLCVCSWISPVATQTQFLILQHPKEPDHELGSARIAHLCLPHSVLKVGLSWPNLSVALGQQAKPSEWGVLYLGSGLKEKINQPISFINRQGRSILPPNPIQGFVILDGSWSQAKALWWRNPWLLKLKRVILSPTQKSLYQDLRKEPRKECLSTLESIVELLKFQKEPLESSKTLLQIFSELLNKKRNLQKTQEKSLSQRLNS